MAAPVIESYWQWAGGEGDAFGSPAQIEKPLGTQKNDVLVCVVNRSANSNNVHALSGGWTQIYQAQGGFFTSSRAMVFWKVAGDSEPSSWDLTFTGAARFTASVFRISGADTSAPINVSATGNTGSTTASPATPSVTTTAAECLLLSVLLTERGNAAFSKPSGMSLAWSQINTTASGTSSAVASEVRSAAGATGTRTWGLGAAQWCHLVSIAIAPAAGGGTDVTGTLAATETGADTASFAGTVAAPGITGTLAATESGADTASFSGSVLVSGALSATETGSDVAAFAGSVSVSGALAATETGSDTFAAAGSVLVSGSMSAQEAGNDNFAGSGSVLVSGSLAAVESGADTFAAIGTVVDAGGPVTGTLAAVETGSDTAAFTGELEGAAPGYTSSGGVGTSYAYKTLSQIKREKKAELAAIKKAATERVEAALDHVDPQEASQGLLSLVKQEVAATVPQSMTWLTPAMLNGIVNSIMSFQRAQIRRELIRRQEEEDEEDVEILLLAA